MKISAERKGRGEMRAVILFFVFLSYLFSASVEEKSWENGQTLLSFLQKNNLPSSIYYNLDKEEQELTEEIRAGVDYFILRSEGGGIEQVLIPINDELQLHISKSGDEYILEAIPVLYQKENDAFAIEISRSPYQDIIDQTGNTHLANELLGAFKNSVNFSRDLKQGDRLVVIYNQKIRLGKIFGAPVIEAAMIETRGKKNYIYMGSDGAYYNDKGEGLESFLLKNPVLNARISSHFTLKRFHPILKRYRAHLGVDYAARKGTPVLAAGDGKVVFAGEKGGYGKVLEIRHENGYKSLYAHLDRFKQGISVGRHIKQGEIVGYVGNTGMSTGPHLHFGLYKNNQAVNPELVVSISKTALSGQKRQQFMALVAKYNRQINNSLLAMRAPKKFEELKYLVSLERAGNSNIEG